MAVKRKRYSSSDDADDWLVTYADAITLLLAFFVTLTAISKINVPIFEEVSAGIASELGKKDVVRPIALLESAIKQILSDIQVSSDYTITKDEEGVVVEFPGSMLFVAGSADLIQGAVPALEEIALTTKADRYDNYVIEIQGHTNSGSSGGQFPTNWELSAIRAAQVARFFQDANIPSSRLSAHAFADGRPKKPEPTTDEQGNIIQLDPGAAPTGQPDPNAPVTDNDRIVIRIHPRIDPDSGYGIPSWEPAPP